jgi:hypothetical protein
VVLPLQLLVAALGAWLHHEQADLIAFLFTKENRILRPDSLGSGCGSKTASADGWPNWDTASVAAYWRRSRPS